MSDSQLGKVFGFYDEDDDDFVRYNSDEEESDYEGGAETAGGSMKKKTTDKDGGFEKLDVSSKVPKSKKVKGPSCGAKTFSYLFPA